MRRPIRRRSPVARKVASNRQLAQVRTELGRAVAHELDVLVPDEDDRDAPTAPLDR